MLKPSNDSSGAWQITFESEALVMGTLGCLCVAIWSQKPDHAHVRIQRERLEAVVAHQQKRSGFLCVVADRTEPPAQPEREASAAMIASHDGKLDAVACVIEGSGFRSAISRTAISGMILLLRKVPPVRVFDQVELAVPWLSARLVAADFSTLAESIARARRRQAPSAARTQR
jgi:hypothetical protein